MCIAHVCLYVCVCVCGCVGVRVCMHVNRWCLYLERLGNRIGIYLQNELQMEWVVNINIHSPTTVSVANKDDLFPRSFSTTQ